MFTSFFNCRACNLFPTLLFIVWSVDCGEASLGDSFPSYKLCVKTCKENTCDRAGYYYKHDNSSALVKIFDLRWRCVDDCQYACMWNVVDSFAHKGWPPPQFHGKWPFVRWLGLQEPASVIFSVLNLAVHLIMLYRFRSQVRSGGPMYRLWSFYFFVCVNAWIWSAIFHSRDLPFTEFMDYLSAFSMVFYSLYGMLMRMLIGSPHLLALLLTLVFLSFFLNHAAYLITDQFDYQYNMTANIVIGFVSAGCSAIWSALNWRRHSHSRQLALCLTWGVLTTLLEISDFPPIAWTFDAHSLWHLSTIPVPYFFWSFVIEDLKYLRKTYIKER